MSQYFKVGKDYTLEKLPNVTSPVELSEGCFLVKPNDGEGCWMDAVVFSVLDSRVMMKYIFSQANGELHECNGCGQPLLETDGKLCDVCEDEYEEDEDG